MYLTIKLIHIVSAAVLFGTGAGIAFFKWQAYRSKQRDAIRVTAEHVVLADWLFTAPAVIVQFLSGIWLTHYLGISFSSTWFIVVVAIFVTVGACWIPVVWIQIRLARLARSTEPSLISQPRYRRLMQAWVILGIPAFAGTLLLFALMVFKPGLG